MSEHPTTEGKVRDWRLLLIEAAAGLDPATNVSLLADVHATLRRALEPAGRHKIISPPDLSDPERASSVALEPADGCFTGEPEEPLPDAARYQFLRAALFRDWDWWCRLSRETADEAEFDAKVDAARAALTKREL